MAEVSTKIWEISRAGLETEICPEIFRSHSSQSLRKTRDFHDWVFLCSLTEFCVFARETRRTHDTARPNTVVTLTGRAAARPGVLEDGSKAVYYIAIFFEVRPIHACTLVPLWHVRPTSGNRRGIALATQGAHRVTAVSCPPDPCKKIRHLPSR